MARRLARVKSLSKNLAKSLTESLEETFRARQASCQEWNISNDNKSAIII